MKPGHILQEAELARMSRDELRALQWERLQLQLAYNYARSPFYRRRFDDLRIGPQDVRSWEDFRRLPTMDKEDHRCAQEESIERFGHPFGMLGCAPPDQFVILSATSGTTGTPTFYTVTQNDLRIFNEMQARKWRRIGLRPGDRVLNGYSLSMFVGGIPLLEAFKSYGACVIPVGAEVGSRRILEFAKLTRPRMMVCTPSYAEYLAEKAPEVLGIPARELGIELILCGGEPGAGLPAFREKIESAYGAKLYDTIGVTHTFHGFGCDAHDGMHLISEDYCVLELLNPETKQAVELRDGAVGEMVFTYLGIEGTPLLRYALGDVLQISTSACSCGWYGPRFRILGRSDDMLIVKGVNVYPGALRNLVAAFTPRTTGQMRVILDKPGHHVTPPLRLVVERGDIADAGLAALKAEMEAAMREKLKVRPEIEFVASGSLERSSHKTKLIEVREPVQPAPRPAAVAAVKEVNLVCMSGQGSVQTLELMAKAYFEQHRSYVGSVVFPGARAKSTPVVSYLKVSERPIASTSTNFDPGVVVVFWEGLLRVAAKNGHDVVKNAIARLRRGTLIVNTTRAPAEIDLPFEFEGTVATVDASGIAENHLKRNPPPVGVTLMGAYAAVTGSLDMDLLVRLVMERFPGKVGENNVAAMREAHDGVRILRDVRGRRPESTQQELLVDPEALPVVEPIAKRVMPGHAEGSPFIWRDKVPVCNDAKCLCTETCLSEAMCPDATGFIVRKGIEGAKQGYRVDVDFCRGCSLCAEVCVYGALDMVNEQQRLATHPGYAGITVTPYRTKSSGGSA